MYIVSDVKSHSGYISKLLYYVKCIIDLISETLLEDEELILIKLGYREKRK